MEDKRLGKGCLALNGTPASYLSIQGLGVMEEELAATATVSSYVHCPILSRKLICRCPLLWVCCANERGGPFLDGDRATVKY